MPVSLGYVKRRVLIEEVDRFERDLDNLARHDREIFNSRDVIDTKLNKEDNVFINHLIFVTGPRTNTSSAAGLICVLPAGEELIFAMLDDVDVMVCELGPFVVKGVLVRDDILERWDVDLVCDWLPVDRVAICNILYLERAVCVVVEIVTARCLHHIFGDSVSSSMWVEF